MNSRYQIVKQIGEGGCSVVYQAYDRRTDRFVALKRPQYPECNRATKRESESSLLVREYMVLSRLRHPNIIQVLDFGFDDDRQPFLVMEFLDGATSLDRASLVLRWSDRVAILLQILLALSYLHRRGLLHRDVKPPNILAWNSSEGPKAKLLDFGLAALPSEDCILGVQVAGSVGYMPPEIQRGGEPSTDMDLFALGILAYELLIGVHPLRERTMFERLLGSWGNISIPQHDEELSPALAKVLRRALNRDRKERYSDAMQFATELAHAAGTQVPAETADVHAPHPFPATTITGANEHRFL